MAGKGRGRPRVLKREHVRDLARTEMSTLLVILGDDASLTWDLDARALRAQLLEHKATFRDADLTPLEKYPTRFRQGVPAYLEALQLFLHKEMDEPPPFPSDELPEEVDRPPEPPREVVAAVVVEEKKAQVVEAEKKQAWVKPPGLDKEISKKQANKPAYTLPPSRRTRGPLVGLTRKVTPAPPKPTPKPVEHRPAPPAPPAPPEKKPLPVKKPTPAYTTANPDRKPAPVASPPVQEAATPGQSPTEELLDYVAGCVIGIDLLVQHVNAGSSPELAEHRKILEEIAKMAMKRG